MWTMEMRERKYKTEEIKEEGGFGSSNVQESISSDKTRGCFSSKTLFFFLPRLNQIQWAIT